MKKLVEICDVCGEKIATEQRVIDVCEDHSSLGVNQTKPRRARKAAHREPCPVCGRSIGVQGMQNHMRTHETVTQGSETEKTAEETAV